MNMSTNVRNLLTRCDRRAVVAAALITTTAMVGGIAYAAAGSDARAEQASPADETREPPSTRSPRPPGEPEQASAAPPRTDARTTASSRPDDARARSSTGSSLKPEPDGSSTTAPPTTTVLTSTTSTTAPAGRAGQRTGTTNITKPAPTTTAAPTPDELEPEPGPGAGQVIALGGTTDRPERTVPARNAVPLDPLDEGSPPPPPPVVNFPNAAGGLVSNVPGCASGCISHARLQPSLFSPDLAFDLKTKVDTTASIWVSETQPVIDGGYPVVNGWPDYLRPGWVKTWQTTIDLEHDTAYWFVLRVQDAQGGVQWAIANHTTAPVGDQLAAPGDGCYFQCIEFGKVEFTDSYDTVVLVIGTDVSATEDVVFEVAVSTAAPSWVADKPVLAAQFPFIVDQDGGNDVRGHVGGLAPETTYHVVVKAIDEDGFMAHAVGQFTTDPAPPTDVRVTWERFFVHYDGDAGAWGRGEIAWAWGMADSVGTPRWVTPYTTYGARNQEKIGDATSIVLGQNTHHWVSVPAGAPIPAVAVNVHENDTHGNIEYDNCIDYRQATLGWQEYMDGCMTRTNVALAEGLTLADIAGLPKCWQFDVPDIRGEDRCLVIESLPANDQHARFDALISFHVPD